MFIDARTIAPDSALEADICIIGAGAAGISMARELAGGPYRVALVESGDLAFDRATQALYEGELVGIDYTPLAAARVRYFGGTTNHWSGWCWPLDEIDFEERPWIPGSGWPFGRSELDPFYVRAQPICELGPYRYDVAFWASGTLEAFPLNAANVSQKILQFSPPTHFGTVYRSDIERAANITTYLNANVVNIETSEEAGRVTRVRVACLSGNRFWLKAKFFVLATGGIENARLLLQSNSTQPAGLGNSNDLVGRYFADHVEFVESVALLFDPQISTALYTKGEERLPLRAMVDGGRMERFLRDADEKRELLAWLDAGAPESGYRSRAKDILDENCVPCHSAGGVGFFAPLSTYDEVMRAVAPRAIAGDGSEVPGLSRKFRSALTLPAEVQRRERLANYNALLNPGVWSDLVKGDGFFEAAGNIAANLGALLKSQYRKYFDPDARRKVLQLHSTVEPAPNPESRVTLGHDRDALGQNVARLDWQLSKTDKRTLQRSEELVGIELGRSGIGRLMKAWEFEDSGWPDTMLHSWHHMGTTRMHNDPRRGVVDANCRVHGVANLYIAGSSVFPTYGYANPTLTIVAMSLRLADHIKAII